MGENSNIQWTDHTFNPWEGCTKVSPGCTNCYAETRNKRFGGDNWGKGKDRRRTSKSNWHQPIKWNREAESADIFAKRFISSIPFDAEPLRPRVFCASLADWLDDEVPIEWLADLLRLIADTPHLDWQLLTKRPQNWSERLHGAMRVIHDGTDDWISGWLDGDAPRNVWMGTSVEDQKRADERIPELLKIPAKVRFLSVEPLLGPVDLKLKHWYYTWSPVMNACSIDWVIIGGESGPSARPCNLEWVSDIVRQCKTAGVACFVKQLGAVPFASTDLTGAMKLVLEDKKGGDMSEWPEDLQIREFPVCQK